MSEKAKIGQGTAIYAVVLLLIAGLGGGAFFAWKEYAKPAPPPVTTKPQSKDPSSETYTGKIRATKTLLIPAPMEGVLEEVVVADGEEVYEGQSLGRITNSTLAAAKQKAEEDLDRAKTKLADLESQLIAARLEASRAGADLVRVKAEYEGAAKNYERQKMLFREGAAARKVFDQSEAVFRKASEERKQLEDGLRGAEQRVAALQGSVESARNSLNEATTEMEETDAEILTGEIKSPVSGLLVSHKKNSGDEVTRDIGDLFEIAVDLMALEVVVDIPATLVGKVEAGGNALVQISEAGTAPLEAKVREVKEGQVYVEFLSPNPAIKPGLSAQVRFLMNSLP